MERDREGVGASRWWRVRVPRWPGFELQRRLAFLLLMAARRQPAAAASPAGGFRLYRTIATLGVLGFLGFVVIEFGRERAVGGIRIA